MPVAGLEPARLLNRLILSQVRLPIPPHRQNLKTDIYFTINILVLQAFFACFLLLYTRTEIGYTEGERKTKEKTAGDHDGL